MHVSLGIPSGVCVAGSVVTFVVGCFLVSVQCLASPTATPSLSLAALAVSVGCGGSEAAERVSPPRMWSVVDRGCGLLRLSLFVCVLSSVVWRRGVGLLID